MIKKDIIFLLIFVLSGCSQLQDSKEVFLKKIQGSWRTSSEVTDWFQNNLSVSGIMPNMNVSVSANGSFSIGTATFTFLEIDKDGILGVYRIIYSGTLTKYVGIGFGQKGDVLALNAVATQEQVVSSQKGVLFLIK